MSAHEFCRIARDGAVLTITIERPDVLNALHPPAHRELAQAFDDFARDPALRVAILTGSGDRAFCVGSDLKARAALGRDDMPATGFAGITMRFDLLKPVIAAVNGLAIGGGFETALACDLVIAADHAAFAFPEPRVGLTATGGGGLQRLARQIPLKQAMALILTGRRISAVQALGLGLVNEVVPGAELMARARGWAAEILAGAPLAVEASKQVALSSLAHADLAQAVTADYPALRRALASADAIEGPRAFAAKRPPRWRGE
jgi:crotonobetainyl-CoA hydratase